MNQLNQFFLANIWVLILLLLWVLFWKGCALWIAAKNNRKWWFLVLLIVNTFGILDIFYIFIIAKNKWCDIKEIFIEQRSNIVN